MNNLPNVFKISGVPKHYDWGGTEYIPKLLNEDNSKRKPYAELWFGAHPSSPSIAAIKENQSLQEIISGNEVAVLGEHASSLFEGRLPFLLKILDVKKMLSIQSHPTKSQARIGFAAENKNNIPITAFERVFKDDNHSKEYVAIIAIINKINSCKQEISHKAKVFTV